MSHHAICPTCLSNFQSFDENPQNLSNFTGPVGVGFGCRQPLFLTFVCRVDAAKQEDERQRRATSRTTSSIAPFAPFTQTALCVVETDSCVVSFICPIPTCARPKDPFWTKVNLDKRLSKNLSQSNLRKFSRFSENITEVKPAAVQDEALEITLEDIHWHLQGSCHNTQGKTSCQGLNFSR